MFSLLADTFLWDFYRTGFLSHSLSTRLIAICSVDRTLGLLEAGAQCAPYIHAIARISQSVDRRGISIAVAIRSLDTALGL